MLSREIVEDGYRQLCSVFGRKGKDDTIDAWWEHLRHRINAAQFMAGVDGVIEHERSFPPPAVVLEYAYTHRGREKGTPYLYGRPLRDVVEDIEERRSPLEFAEVPRFWEDDTERLNHLNAVEHVRDETGGLPGEGSRLKPGAFLKAVLDRLGVKPPQPTEGMQHALDDGIDDGVPF